MDAVEQAVLVVAGTGALLLFAAYARRDEPDRYRRAAPWIVGLLLVRGVD
jgi:hypothetical protein